MLESYIFLETSPAAAGTAVSSQVVSNAAGYLPAGVAGPLDSGDVVDVLAELVGATGGTLDVYVQTSPDEGLTWQDAIHFAQLGAGASAINYRAQLTPHPQPSSAAPVVVGLGLTPALAASTVVQGTGFNRARLAFVAGTSTSVGASIKVIMSVQRARHTS